MIIRFLSQPRGAAARHAKANPGAMKSRGSVFRPAGGPSGGREPPPRKWHHAAETRPAPSAKARSAKRDKMKIAKFEDFHVDGGWDTYSFLQITTAQGLYA